ncbi:MAG: HPr family phosphocarrier protein [Treponema sp.]|jgi:phosphocarrier protein|nr:HPr family phosphocarrier protein [Treponema sp.]
MKEYTYLIKDELGLHARPAGLLVKMAAKYKCDIQLGTPAKMVNAKRIIGVMALTLKQGQKMTMTFSGEDEEEAAAAVEAFLKENAFEPAAR